MDKQHIAASIIFLLSLGMGTHFIVWCFRAKQPKRGHL